jgi:hypothetical protein
MPKLIIEIGEDGNMSVFSDIPLEVEYIDWKDVKEQAESCPSLFANLPEQTEKHMLNATTGMIAL